MIACDVSPVAMFKYERPQVSGIGLQLYFSNLVRILTRDHLLSCLADSDIVIMEESSVLPESIILTGESEEHSSGNLSADYYSKCRFSVFGFATMI